MKIIKHGNACSRIKCKQCSCIFEYAPEDIIVDRDWEALSDSDEIDLVDCRGAFPDLDRKYKSVMALGWTWKREANVRCPECGRIEQVSESFAFDQGAEIIVSEEPFKLTDGIYDDILERKCTGYIGMTRAIIKDITGDGEFKYGYLKVLEKFK